MAIPQQEVSEFDIMRQRIREREQKRGKEATEQVKGQFASRGMLASGAQIKGQERAQQAVAEQAREERRDVLVAEADVRRREREAQAQRAFAGEQARLGRQFQRGERIGGQEFAARQADAQRRFAAMESRLGREFTSAERQAAQRFASAEAALGRDFTRSEREALQTFQAKMEQGRQDFTAAERQAAQTFASAEAAAQRTFAGEQAQLSRTEQARQFDVTMSEQEAMRIQNANQFNQEMTLNRQNSRINALNALKNAGWSDSQISGILGDLGVQGLGGFGGGGFQFGQPGTALPTNFSIGSPSAAQLEGSIGGIGSPGGIPGGLDLSGLSSINFGGGI